MSARSLPAVRDRLDYMDGRARVDERLRRDLAAAPSTAASSVQFSSSALFPYSGRRADRFCALERVPIEIARVK